MKKTETWFSNGVIGIPGGLLIFMGTLMFNSVLSLVIKSQPWEMLTLLCVTSLVVGMIARWFRPIHGLGAAFASGFVASATILLLRLTSHSELGDDLVFSTWGMLAPVLFATLGGWWQPHLHKGNS